MAVSRVAASEAHQSRDQAQAEMEAAVFHSPVLLGPTAQPIRLPEHWLIMQVAAEVAVGSLTLLAVQAVQAVAVPEAA